MRRSGESGATKFVVHLVGDVVIGVDAINAGGGIGGEVCVILLVEFVELVRVESVLVCIIAFLAIPVPCPSLPCAAPAVVGMYHIVPVS